MINHYWGKIVSQSSVLELSIKAPLLPQLSCVRGSSLLGEGSTYFIQGFTAEVPYLFPNRTRSVDTVYHLPDSFLEFVTKLLLFQDGNKQDEHQRLHIMQGFPHARGNLRSQLVVV